ncbi:DUF1273 domain-containing protein [Fructilactobacillus florum]|uniref:UPF0398 protein FC87_GL000574 n=1 Tax=Fructilactobacillus florum DSM 22689 = JCM 16035 TaxID=1423745 RepID=A0A0R2CUV9_9LACO|nr:DUF1273 domain-containing protein [Fructilactobacillus florum]KRM91750.1 hypothetical protein FC87_GL000574 [Fructilactobacillus florum DSM 22689 = JCM 16035]
MSRAWITGYRSYELGIFNPKDPKAQVVFTALQSALQQLLEAGCTWIITGAQLGIEQWTVQIAHQLKQQYPQQFEIGVILPFADFGTQWNEANRARLQATLSRADFSASVSEHPYTSPQQLKNYQQFMLSHTDQALLVYDTEQLGKPEYDYRAILQFREHQVYPFQIIDFDDLEETAESLNPDNDDL